MRKKCIALSFIAVAAGAHAQSSVTLYGIIDNGFIYQNGRPDGRLVGLQSGGYNESRWGLQGAEDLGGGTKATFTLEGGMSTLNGNLQNGSFFGRHAVVGVSNETFGVFDIGNMGNSEIQVDSYYIDPQVMQLFSIATLVRGRNWTQAGNGLEYISPTWGGLTFRAQYELTNNPNGWNSAPSSSGISGTGPNQLGGAQGRTDGIDAIYKVKNLELVALYDETRDPNGKFSNVYVSSRSILAGGTYDWGAFKAYAGYQHLSAPDASFASNGVTASAMPAGVSDAPTDVNHEWVGLGYTATPSLGFKAAVYHANANNGNGSATLYTLGSTYLLSKRTFLYAELAYIHNSSTSNVGLGDGYTDPYGPNMNQGGAAGNVGPSYGHGQLGAIAGISTTF